jgi:hypothetical protein
MTQENPDQEKRIAEFNSLRNEILNSDNTCLWITAYLIAAVAALFAADEPDPEWLVSFLSFIALCYFTEKRFIIRRIGTYIKDELNDISGWEKYIEGLRTSNSGLRPTNLLRPYNSELLICFGLALLPYFLSNLGIKNKLDNSQDPYAIFWLVFFLMVVYLSIVNGLEYNLKKKSLNIKFIGLFRVNIKFIGLLVTVIVGFLLTKKNPWILAPIIVVLFLVAINFWEYLLKLFLLPEGKQKWTPSSEDEREGITRSDLIKKLGFEERTQFLKDVAAFLKKRDVDEYLEELSGWQKRHVEEVISLTKFYPPEEDKSDN